MEYTKVEVAISPMNEIARDLLMAQMGDIGFDSFSESTEGFDAFIPSKDYNNALLSSLELPFDDIQLAFNEEVIPDQNWNKKWEENYFQPIIIGNDCVIRSPFHTSPETAKYEILIMPKMAFGTGHHSTTSLMVRYILKTKIADLNVLDMGCGTGILGILASLRGAKHIDGIDIDEWAYNNALESLALNKINNMDIKLGGAELIKSETYDLVLANINRNILLQDIHNYSRSLKPKGELILSGFYSEDLEIVSKETAKHGLRFVSSKIDNNWMAASYTKVD